MMTRRWTLTVEVEDQDDGVAFTEAMMDAHSLLCERLDEDVPVYQAVLTDTYGHEILNTEATLVRSDDAYPLCVSCGEEVTDPTNPSEETRWVHLDTFRAECDPDDLRRQGHSEGGHEASPDSRR